MTPRSRAARRKQLEKARDGAREKYGRDASSLGHERFAHNVVPSPSLMVDYKLGTGGFPHRYTVEVFGANTIGKSSAIVYPTIANAQKQEKLVALIAAEPAFDPDWATKLGVDTELLWVERPDHIEQAFEMLHDLVYEHGNLIDYIVFDSIGGMGTKSETETGGKKAFGISGATTSGLNLIMPRLWKNNQGLMLINQQRQDTKHRAQPGMLLYDSPGGEALKHHAVIRLQLKPGKDRWTKKMGSGKDAEDVLVGRELVLAVKKNKLAINSKAAKFNFFHIPTPEYGFGVDRVEDLLRVGKLTGIFKSSGSWMEHESFPNGKVNGKAGLTKALAAWTEIAAKVREEVLAQMRAEQVALRERMDAGIIVPEESEGSPEDE